MPFLNKFCHRLAFGALFATALLGSAHAQHGYPEKAVRLVVPWPAGGAADAVGRLIAQALTTQLGKSVFVENVAGAGGNIGTLQDENAKLKRMYADLALMHHALKDVVDRKL